MEIGSHDRLKEGALSLEPANGASQYPSDEEATAEGGGAAVVKPEWAGGVPPGQCQAPGNGKASDLQQHLPCWGGGGGTRGEPVLPADMEDARNLVAFSTSLISLPPKISSSDLQPHTAQLYEKFNQEMDAEGAEGRISGGGAPEGGSQPPEDLSTLQTALSQAKHGHKPPNCNCDGPDCPDYLEWLEKRIKLAGRDDQAPCKMASAPHLHSPHPHTHHTHPHHPQVNGAHPLSGLHQQLPRPAPIPCSPQVLSIAKEKNVSLQTAIAIEALTQLSAAGPHPHQRHHPQHLPPHPQHGTRLLASSPGPPTSCSSSSSSHSPSSSSPFPGPGQPPGFGPHPKQQQQGSGQSNQWMMMNSSQPTPSPSGADPMSELKQLLGDASGKFTGAPFKLPVPHHHHHRGLNVWGPQPALARIKQEPDSGEYLDSACASMGHYGLLNGQQQYPGPPLSPGSAAIRHSTQAALQQHLHHKRNLFSAAGLGPLRSPQACQDLRKWWPQSPGLEGFPLPPAAIKQEAKEPKRRKSSQASPLLKNLAGVGPPGTPVPKPKAIVIKKTKQKASLPTFLPQSQISVQKPSAVTAAQAPPSPHPGSFLSPSVFNPLQSLPAPAQTQVPILVSSIAPLTAAPPVLTENTPAVSFPQPQPAAPQPQASSGGDGPPASATSSASTTPLTSAPPPATSQTLGLTSLDPKFEELIRQFEAEFGDGSFTSDPSLSQSRPPGQAPAAQPAANESQPDANANANSGPDRCASPSGAQSAPLPLPTSAPLPADWDQEMEEVDRKDKESGSQSEAAPTQSQSEAASTQSQSDAASTQSQSDAASPQRRTESPTAELRAGALPLTLPQEALMDTPQHQAPEDPFATPISPFPKRMKIESSGGLTVLSTTCFSEEDTPTKDSLPFSPSLRGFLESPLQYLSSPTQSLLDTPSKDAPADCPTCDCVEQILEKDEGPYYNHLGSGPTVASIRDLMENRYGEKGEAIRIERVIYTGREGKSSQGCPIAKWVIRRSSETEKLLCLVRHRAGHHCPNAVIVILIMVWDGVPRALGDKLYREIAESLTKFGNPTSRRCGLNDDRTCACQGKDPDTCGASFSFGCSWSMYFNGCKYARSKIPRKFRLQGERPEEEDKLRDNFQELATKVAPLYKQLAPQAYNNQCANEQKAPDCRLGLEEGRPFSGVTACMDFCAHAHKDQHNLHNGSTVVCTLTKEDNRKVGEIPEDEQLHVLPLYKLAVTDEFGSEENQLLKAQTCGLQLLHNFRREVRKLPERAKSCRQRRLEAKAKASEKKKGKLPDEKTPEKAVVKTEVRHTGSNHPQLGNKAIPKQEVKPIIKTEPFIKKEPFNGALEGYPAQGPDPYGLYPHPAHPAYYARGGLPPNGQPPAPGPVNGYHPNLPALPYGYYGYPTNALFPPEFVGYDGRNGPWPKAGAAAAPLDQKPDVQSLQARLAHSYPSHLDAANRVQSRPSSVSSEPCHRGTPVIKQEPEDVPVYEGGAGQSQSRAGTPCATPQPEAWPGHKPNGRMASGDWEGGARPASGPPPDSPFTPAKQQFHQQPPQQPSPYPQQKEQWNPYPAPGTPMASPAPSPSPSMKAAPSPSPSLGPSNPHHWGSPAPSPQPKAWPAGSAGYSPGAMTTHGHPAGALPDKTWPKAGESRGSTPLGLQENAWRLCGGSAAGSTPSPAPEGRSFPDALQQTDAQACWSTNRAAESDAESATGHDEEVWSDSEHNFMDPNIGGVAVAPAHGSILMECARRELHATTPLKKPNRCHPTRISLVFYQHKNLNQPCHGLAMWEAKMKLLEERARQRQQEAALLGLSQEEIKAYGKKRKWGAAALAARVASGPAKDKREGPATRLSTTHHTTSTVTVSPFAFTKVTGPYSHFV